MTMLQIVFACAASGLVGFWLGRLLGFDKGFRVGRGLWSEEQKRKEGTQT